MDEVTQKALRSLPGVDELLETGAAAALLQSHPRAQVVEAVRTAGDAARRTILEAGAGAAEVPPESPEGPMGESSGVPEVSAEQLLAGAAVLLESWTRPGLRRVLNLTGVVVHTNLGRASLAPAAIERVIEAAGHYSTLEYDLEAGGRGRRETHVEALLARLTGAEAAFAVNNNAGAVLLLLMGLASGRDVLVSRGQLVEIGGSFRLPDIMKAGGVRLVEVGTTNRTRVSDFEDAITADTALILRVHTSNYRIMGFTEEAELSELVELGRRRGILVADDLGSGALLAIDAFAGEPTVTQSLRAGVDVVCFSGDKLMGGPQSGILLGRAEVIGALRRHPVARALRLDKMTLAALEATMQLYADPEAARRAIPALCYLSRTPEETAALAAALQRAIEKRCADGFILEVEETTARAGGGSLPTKDIPSHAVRIRLGGATITALEAALRRAPLPVIARVAQDSIYLDVLALAEDEVDLVADGLDWAAGQTVGSGGSAARSGPREPDSLDPSAPVAPAHGRRPGDAPRPTRGSAADG